MLTTRQQARSAGFLYLLLGVTAPLGLIYVPGKLLVAGNAAATAENLRRSESLLRAGMASELFHQAVCVFLVLALYRLFKPVDESLARQLVALGALVSVPIMFVNVLNEIAAWRLASGTDLLAAFNQQQLDGLAFLFYRLHSQGVIIASIFWGLWLFPFGRLVIRSGFIPRILGVLLMLAGAGYLATAFGSLIVPQYAAKIRLIGGPLQIAELPIIFWLAIWGAWTPKEQR
jgi:hypothetical protein